MHSFLVGLAYIAMLFAPCAAAQWGDVLMKPYFGIELLEWFFAPRKRRALTLDPLLAMMQSRAEASELASLVSAAFIAPVHLPPFRRAAPETFAEAMNRKPQSAQALEKAAAQVAARLAQLVEAHRLVNTVVMQKEAVPATAEEFATPTIAELDALYAPQAQPAFAAAVPFAVDTGTTLHLLPALVGAGAGPPGAPQSSPIAFAA